MSTGSQRWSSVTESELIESVRLSSSAASELRLCGLGDTTEETNDTVQGDESDVTDDPRNPPEETRISNGIDRFAFLQSEEISPRRGDASSNTKFRGFPRNSRVPLSETDLIQNAKLADDELHHERAIALAHELDHDRKEITADKDLDGLRWNHLQLPPEQDGCKTPVNSEDGLPLVPTQALDSKLNQPDDLSMDADLRKLIREIVYKLDDCYMEDIVAAFKGTWFLEEGLLSDTITPAQVLGRLQHFRFVSRDNVHLLQALVVRLDDSDLYGEAVRYIRHHHGTVYFYPELEQLPPGFRVVKCQVAGRDFTRLSREDLELVRFKVASVLFLSSRDTYIVGIEPGTGVLQPWVGVSLMLPERYVQELAEMAPEGLSELSAVGIIAFKIDGHTFRIKCRDVQLCRPSERDQTQFLSVYQQLRERTKHQDERDQEVAALREEVNFKQLELDTLGAQLELFTQRALHETIGRYRPRVHIPIRRRHKRSRTFPLDPNDHSPRSPRRKELKLVRSPRISFNETRALKEAVKDADEEQRRNNENALVLFGVNLKDDDTSAIKPPDDVSHTRTSGTWYHSHVCPQTAVRHMAEANTLMNEIQCLLGELSFMQELY